MRETLRGYKSQDGASCVYKVITAGNGGAEIRELVARAKVGPLDGFVSPRTGNRFSAKLRIKLDPKDEAKRKANSISATRSRSASSSRSGPIPRPAPNSARRPTSYILRERDGDGWKQTFSVGRLMCQKPIAREHAIQMVPTGNPTSSRASSRRKGRPFDAFLLRKGAVIAWEFPPRDRESPKATPRQGRQDPIARKAKLSKKKDRADFEFAER
jgi:DNA topoisomerase III